MGAAGCSLTLSALLSSAAAAAPAPPAGPPPCPPRAARLFVAPMGEPFRGAGDGPAPAAAWFAAADADGDGRLTAAEMAADADRFFKTLDQNGDGEIAPAEVARYENVIAPEIRLYQSGAWTGVGPDGDGQKRPKVDRRRNPKGGDFYAGELGAGRYAWLNVPEPVASADLDMNRGVSAAEFRSVALARFALLDKAGAKALTLAALPAIPTRQPPCPAADGKRRRR